MRIDRGHLLTKHDHTDLLMAKGLWTDIQVYIGQFRAFCPNLIPIRTGIVTFTCRAPNASKAALGAHSQVLAHTETMSDHLVPLTEGSLAPATDISPSNWTTSTCPSRPINSIEGETPIPLANAGQEQHGPRGAEIKLSQKRKWFLLFVFSVAQVSISVTRSRLYP